MVAQLLGRLRRALQRALHPSRRAQAVARLEEAGRIRGVLVICLGNICRSPFAAALLARRLTEHDIVVHSAGLIGPGRHSPPAAIGSAATWGVDLRDHRSRVVTPALLAEVDLVVAMDTMQRGVLRHDYGVPDRAILLLGDIDPGPFPGRAIADPYDRPRKDFDAVYTRIERCTEALSRILLRVNAATPRRHAPVTRSRTHSEAPRISASSS